jgi:hypothetical protein
VKVISRQVFIVHQIMTDNEPGRDDPKQSMTGNFNVFQDPLIHMILFVGSTGYKNDELCFTIRIDYLNLHLFCTT